MKTTGARPPDWAILLVAQVCAEHGRRVPGIQWWHRDDWYSSGHEKVRMGMIHVTAGTDILDQQGVVLHEVCHHLCPKSWWHNKRFYGRLFPMYEKWLGEDGLAEMVRREALYMKRSIEVAQELYTR